MIDHFALLLDAYLDKELPPSKVHLVEEHVKTCLHCQNELNKRRQLIELLKEVPPMRIVEPEAEFIRKVNSQLMARPSNRWQPKSILNVGWQMIPVGLLIMTAFVYTVSLISLIAGSIPGVNEMILGKISGIGFDFPITDPFNIFLWVLGPFQLSHWNWISGTVALIIISLIYLSWLMIWWFQYKTTNDFRMVY